MILGTPLYHINIMKEADIADVDMEMVTKDLLEHLEPYKQFINRREVKEHFEALVKGLLSDLERKTGNKSPQLTRAHLKLEIFRTLCPELFGTRRYAEEISG